ncbi:outer membrane beta-barrel family protein [Flavobacterium crassostreae]|uniref:outer membrane beta-barrel family protein n=1 Tax=Flavobacterium crassostreae TaxID=1763534 RepID=UPI001E48D03E|nr:outer membrane beta-barrel family protein [Flavobacterium crassostreae]
MLFLAMTTVGFSQNVDLENIGGFIGRGKPLKISGAVSANSIFYDSNQSSGRAPFTYYLQGSLNVSFMALSMPVSYSYSNQGANLDYQVPYKFNRLSLHPKYKWIQAHIGDANMSFSPYTLSGYQFTGGGVELSPKGHFKIAAMAGRLLKATEDTGDERTVPAFSRFGYGAKINYEQEKYSLGIIAFYAKDNINSLIAVPDNKGVTPKENLVVSIDGSYKIVDNLKIKAEYASTAITQDLRAAPTATTGTGIAGKLFNNRASTEHYAALKAGFDYNFKGSSLGVTYERIDPGYTTLGAYFFNNDFENITLNTTTQLFQNKLNLAFNVGYQKDDLENQKEQGTHRTVGSINATFNATQKLMLTGSYSNFSSYTNTKVNQFDVINNTNIMGTISDQMDFKQISQNANLNVNYSISKKETVQKNLNINYSLTDVANAQGGIVRIGDASTFHNMNTSYTLGFPKKNTNITAALNGTVNTIGRENATTWGPTVNVNKKFFDKKLNTGLSSSYNSSQGKSGSTAVTNFRANASYIYKQKHNFNLSAIQLFQSSVKTNNRSLTVTFGYNYNFDIGNIKFNFDRKPQVEAEEAEAAQKLKNKKDKIFSFAYRTHLFSGTHDSISKVITNLLETPDFKGLKDVDGITTKLALLEKTLHLDEEKPDKGYKNTAVHYLDYLYENKDYIDSYNNLVFSSLKILYKDAARIDIAMEEESIKAHAYVNNLRAKGKTISEKTLKYLEVKDKKYNAHKWMQEQMNDLTYGDVADDKGLLKDFKKANLSKVFEMLQKGKKQTEIEIYLEVQLADFYHKKSSL